ncbi:MAG: acyl-[acyl-carrier-protein] thioesterase [Clostridiales bacterium]|nr:acyl-[acyl-carrier-protein] thioesterase [Clostridiales bacterium]
MYTLESRVRYSEIGEDKKMTLNSLLNYFQDCTTFHSKAMGRGMEVLEVSDKAWVLSAWQICVNRYPELGEGIRVHTWPYEFKGFQGGRNFQLTTEAGEALAYANSLWTFLDVKTGMPCRVPPEEAGAYELEEKLDMVYAPRKIPVPKESVEKEAFAVKQYHLDTNHHVNNGQYVRLAQDYIPADFEIHQMRAEYKKQAMLGNVMVPHVAENDGVWTVALCDENAQPYAVVEFR